MEGFIPFTNDVSFLLFVLIEISFFLKKIVNFPKYNVTAVSTEDQDSQCP